MSTDDSDEKFAIEEERFYWCFPDKVADGNEQPFPSSRACEPDVMRFERMPLVSNTENKQEHKRFLWLSLSSEG